MKKDFEKVDTSKLNEKLSVIPYIYSDVLAMYYGLDDMGKSNPEDIADEINDIFKINLSKETVIYILGEAIEMADYNGDLDIFDSQRVITIDFPNPDNIRSSKNMQKEYGCRAVYAVTVDAEDKSDLASGVKKVTMMALNEQGLRKIDSIMKSGYKNPDGIYVRDYAQIIKDRKDAYLIGLKANWQYFLNRRFLLSEDELKFELTIRDKFKDADFVIFPRLRDLFFAANPDVRIFDDESLAYTPKDYEAARNSAAVAAVMLEKRDIIPIAGLDTLLSLPSDILDYIYLGEEEARFAVVSNPTIIADKTDYSQNIE